MRIIQEKIVLHLLVIAMEEGNAHLIKSVSAIKASMVNIVKKVYVRIIAT
jgi:hypothetical protein